MPRARAAAEKCSATLADFLTVTGSREGHLTGIWPVAICTAATDAA